LARSVRSFQSGRLAQLDLSGPLFPLAQSDPAPQRRSDQLDLSGQLARLDPAPQCRLDLSGLLFPLAQSDQWDLVPQYRQDLSVPLFPLAQSDLVPQYRQDLSGPLFPLAQSTQSLLRLRLLDLLAREDLGGLGGLEDLVWEVFHNQT
jgi:hypothetical protein